MSGARTNNHTFVLRGPFKVIVCAITLVAFLFNMLGYEGAWAADMPSELTIAGTERPDSPTIPREFIACNFALPHELGTIRDAWCPPDQKAGSWPAVIHIQDAHCNYGAQLAISRIIEYLNSEYRISVINLEGGAGPYDLSPFTLMDDRRIRQSVADSFMRDGLLNGAEFFAINNPDKVKLWGVEDAKLYVNNLNVYTTSLVHKAENERMLADLGFMLTNLKIKMYPKDLLEFDIKYAQYKADNITFGEYLSYLLKTATQKGIEMRYYSNLQVLEAALKEEAEIDFKKATNEREALIENLRKRLSKKAMEELVLTTVEFKEDKISQSEFYAYLSGRAKMLNIEMKDYPNLERYIRYLGLYEKVNKLKVMDEVDSLQEAIGRTLYENEDQRQLGKLSKNFAIMKMMFRVTLTQNDYKYYKANEEAFGIRSFMDFIERHAPFYKITNVLDKGIYQLDSRRERMAEFYEYSFRRDEAFLANMISADGSVVREAKHGVTILITGGFHTDNMCELFRKNGIAYVSIIPSFLNPRGYQSPYYEILGGTPSGLTESLREIFAGISTIQVASMLSSALGEEVWGRAGIEAFKAAIKLREMAVKEGWDIKGVKLGASKEDLLLSVAGRTEPISVRLADVAPGLLPAIAYQKALAEKAPPVAVVEAAKPAPPTPSASAMVKDALDNEKTGVYIAERLKAAGFYDEAITQRSAAEKQAILDRMIKSGAAFERDGIVFIKIDGLYDNTRQFGHIGLGHTYGRSVVYIDSVYAQNKTIQNHEIEEIRLWSDALKSESALKGVASLANVREWMRKNPLEAVILRNKLHEAANAKYDVKSIDPAVKADGMDEIPGPVEVAQKVILPPRTELGAEGKESVSAIMKIVMDNIGMVNEDKNPFDLIDESQRKAFAQKAGLSDWAALMPYLMKETIAGLRASAVDQKFLFAKLQIAVVKEISNLRPTPSVAAAPPAASIQKAIDLYLNRHTEQDRPYEDQKELIKDQLKNLGLSDKFANVVIYAIGVSIGDMIRDMLSNKTVTVLRDPKGRLVGLSGMTMEAYEYRDPLLGDVVVKFPRRGMLQDGVTTHYMHVFVEGTKNKDEARSAVNRRLFEIQKDIMVREGLTAEEARREAELRLSEAARWQVAKTYEVARNKLGRLFAPVIVRDLVLNLEKRDERNNLVVDEQGNSVYETVRIPYAVVQQKVKPLAELLEPLREKQEKIKKQIDERKAYIKSRGVFGRFGRGKEETRQDLAEIERLEKELDRYEKEDRAILDKYYDMQKAMVRLGIVDRDSALNFRNNYGQSDDGSIVGFDVDFYAEALIAKDGKTIVEGQKISAMSEEEMEAFNKAHPDLWTTVPQVYHDTIRNKMRITLGALTGDEDVLKNKLVADVLRKWLVSPIDVRRGAISMDTLRGIVADLMALEVSSEGLSAIAEPAVLPKADKMGIAPPRAAPGAAQPIAPIVGQDKTTHAGFGIRMAESAYDTKDAVEARRAELESQIKAGQLPQDFSRQSVTVGEVETEVVVHNEILARLATQGVRLQQFIDDCITIRGPTYSGQLVDNLKGKPLIIDYLERSPNLYGNCRDDGYIYVNANAPIEMDVIGVSHEFMHEAGMFSESLEDESELAQQDFALIRASNIDLAAIAGRLQSMGLINGASMLIAISAVPAKAPSPATIMSEAGPIIEARYPASSKAPSIIESWKYVADDRTLQRSLKPGTIDAVVSIVKKSPEAARAEIENSPGILAKLCLIYEDSKPDQASAAVEGYIKGYSTKIEFKEPAERKKQIKGLSWSAYFDYMPDNRSPVRSKDSLSLIPYVEYAIKEGYSNIEIPFEYMPFAPSARLAGEYSSAELAEIKGLCEKYGITISIHSPLIGPFIEGKQMFEDPVDNMPLMYEQIAIAGLMGATKMVVHLVNPDKASEYAQLVTYASKVSPGLKIVFENYKDKSGKYSTAAEFMEAFEKIVAIVAKKDVKALKNIGIIIDTAHYNLVGTEDPVIAARIIGLRVERLAEIYGKDAKDKEALKKGLVAELHINSNLGPIEFFAGRSSDLHTNAGVEGPINNLGVIGILRLMGYEPAVTFEQLRPISAADRRVFRLAMQAADRMSDAEAIERGVGILVDLQKSGKNYQDFIKTQLVDRSGSGLTSGQFTYYRLAGLLGKKRFEQHVQRRIYQLLLTVRNKAEFDNLKDMLTSYNLMPPGIELKEYSKDDIIIEKDALVDFSDINSPVVLAHLILDGNVKVNAIDSMTGQPLSFERHRGEVVGEGALVKAEEGKHAVRGATVVAIDDTVTMAIMPEAVEGLNRLMPGFLRTLAQIASQRAAEEAAKAEDIGRKGAEEAAKAPAVPAVEKPALPVPEYPKTLGIATSIPSISPETSGGLGKILQYAAMKINAAKLNKPVVFLLSGRGGIGKSTVAEAIMKPTPANNERYGFDMGSFGGSDIIPISGDAFHNIFRAVQHGEKPAILGELDTLDPASRLLMAPYLAIMEDASFIQSKHKDNKGLTRNITYEEYIAFYLNNRLPDILEKTGKKVVMWDEPNAFSNFRKANLDALVTYGANIPVSVVSVTISEGNTPETRLAEIVSWEWDAPEGILPEAAEVTGKVGAVATSAEGYLKALEAKGVGLTEEAPRAVSATITPMSADELIESAGAAVGLDKMDIDKVKAIMAKVESDEEKALAMAIFNQQLSILKASRQVITPTDASKVRNVLIPISGRYNSSITPGRARSRYQALWKKTRDALASNNFRNINVFFYEDRAGDTTDMETQLSRIRDRNRGNTIVYVHADTDKAFLDKISKDVTVFKEEVPAEGAYVSLGGHVALGVGVLDVVDSFINTGKADEKSLDYVGELVSALSGGLTSADAIKDALKKGEFGNLIIKLPPLTKIDIDKNMENHIMMELAITRSL
ncbi:MAG: TIM barrel protein [Candidatus Omnitrophica bacterium]|nr:TIM barrel protein [Candidatus Omnitrophota bacterium]